MTKKGKPATYVACKKCGMMISREILVKMKAVHCPYCKEPATELYDLMRPTKKDEKE